MSQHDLTLDNATNPTFRADVNSALQALGSNSKGSTAPSTPYAGQIWVDDNASPWQVKQYDGSDWIDLWTIDTSGNTAGFPSANASQTLAISSGVLAPTGPGWAVVQAETGSVDDLHTITPWSGIKAGDTIILTPNGGETITIDDTGAGSNKIRLWGDEFDMETSQPHVFVWDGTNWRAPAGGEVEQRTFTPTLRSSSGEVSYAGRGGRMYRHGLMMFFRVYFNVNGAGSASTNHLYIEGFPYDWDSATIPTWGFDVFGDNNFGVVNNTNSTVWINSFGSDKLYIYYSNSSDAGAPFTTSQFYSYTANFEVRGWMKL